MFLIKIQCIAEALAQFGQECQRTAEKGHITFNFMTTRKTCNRLIYNGLEYGFRDILMRCALVQQRLHVCLGENTATRRNRINRIGIHRQLVETGCIRLQ